MSAWQLSEKVRHNEWGKLFVKPNGFEEEKEMKKILCLMLTLVLTLSLAAFAFAEEKPVPTNKGIERICMSVTDMETSKAFFTDLMELTFVADGELSREDVKALYGMDASAKYTILKNEVQSTVLELLEFDPKPTTTIRSNAEPWDFGYFDVAFRTQDNDAVYEKFTELGYEFACKPYSYVTTWSGAEVKEGVMYGPDDIPFAMIEKTPNTPEFEGMFRNFPDSVVVVEDMDESDRYYVDTLGLVKAFDMVMEDGLVDPLFGIEKGVHTRIVMYTGSGNTPIVEIIEFTNKKGKNLTEEGISVPANAGTFATCFEVENLEEAIAKHEANGFAARSEVVEYELAPYGKIRSVIVSGPSKVMVELFEIVK